MGYGPENTSLSFDLGWRMGADAVECDVHLSQDGALVVIHDEFLDRTTSGRGLVKDNSWSDIRCLDAGSWFHPRFRGLRPWTLDDLIDWMKDKRAPSGDFLKLILEIKNGPVPYKGIAEAVVNLLTQKNFLERTVAISFDHGVMKGMKMLCRPLRTGLLLATPLAMPFPGLARQMAWAGADGVFPRHSLVTPSLLRTARRHGWFLGTWTANTLVDMKRLIGLGVDAIATNYPDRLVELLNS
jgi:glycerophosphoryl diester phosphodiesterase